MKFVYIERTSNEWVFKVASVIEKNSVNLYRVLMEYDDDFDGIYFILFYYFRLYFY